MSLSRIQLAAALVEYDNDDDDVGTLDKPRNDWRDSAIFIPFHQAEQDKRRQKILSQPPPTLPISLENSQLLSESAPPSTIAVQENGHNELATALDAGPLGSPSHLINDKTSFPPSRRVVSQPLPQTIASPAHNRVQSVYLSESHEGDSDLLEFNAAAAKGRRASTDEYRVNEGPTDNEHKSRLLDRPRSAMGFQNYLRHQGLQAKLDLHPTMIPIPDSPVSISRPFSSLSSGNLSGGPPAHCEEEETLKGLGSNPFALPTPHPQAKSILDPNTLGEQRKPSMDTVPNGFDASPDRRISLPLHTETRRRSTDLSGLGSLTSPVHSLPRGEEYDEIPTPAQYGRPLMPQRYNESALTRMDRKSLRPNVLIMPSPLADSKRASMGPRDPGGFNRGDTLLPAAAKTQGIPLSLSQRTFRGTLLIDGKGDERDWVGGTDVEGEVGLCGRDMNVAAIERRPGKLYGRSLIDELEARKTMVKSKQKVFYGDSRPAMMSRSSMMLLDSTSPSRQSSPTSPDHLASNPDSLHPDARPLLHRYHSNESSSRNNSFDANDKDTRTRSVFGVDHVWEREMARLRVIQEQEERARTLQEGKESEKVRKRKGKGRSSEYVQDGEEYLAVGSSPQPREPLYDAAHEVVTEEQRVKGIPTSDVQLCVAAEDEGNEEGHHAARESIIDSNAAEDDDLPLSRIPRSSRSGFSMQIALGSATQPRAVSDSDSEEDVPLSRIARRSPYRATAGACGPLGLSFEVGAPEAPDYDEDEDDLPLAVGQAKAKGIAPPTRAEIIEDELPLGYKHAEVAQRQAAQRSVASRGVNMMWGWPGPMDLGSMGMTGMPYGTVGGMPPTYMIPQINMGAGMGMGSLGDGMVSPSANIDHWRHEVPIALEPVKTGGQTSLK